MPKNVEKYVEERKGILNKLLNILGINEKNKHLYLRELDNNKEKQEEIYKLEPEIKRYFITSKWSCYKMKTMERKFLSLIKYILKDMNIEYTSNGYSLNTPAGVLSDTIYTIII